MKRDGQLTEYQQQIVEYIGKHQPVQAMQLAKRFGIATTTAKTHLNRLMRRGFVSSNGPGKHAGWTLGDSGWRGSANEADIAVQQCPSVWVYAQRLAAC